MAVSEATRGTGQHPVARRHRPSVFGVQFRWNSLEHFLGSTELSDGVHAFPLPGAEPAVYEFYVRVREGAPVLAHFHGATPRKPNDVPKITGLPISEGLEATLVIPSDPLLQRDDDVRIGWHVGQLGADAFEVAIAVVRHVAAVSAAPRIVAWGGSGGGYAALRVARDIDDSIAFVWNPQTSIDAYSAPSVQAFRKASGHHATVFAGVPRTDLTDPGAWDGYRGTVVYFQEQTDWHVESHLMPVLRALGSEVDAEAMVERVITPIAPTLTVALSHWGQGHAPPPRPIIAHMLRELSANGDIDPVAILESSRPLLLAARALRQEVVPFTLPAAERLVEDDAARRVAEGLLQLRDLRAAESDDLLAASDVLTSVLTDAESLIRAEEHADRQTTVRAGLALLHLARQLHPAAEARRFRAAADRLLLTIASSRAASEPGVGAHAYAPAGPQTSGQGYFVYGSCVTRDAFEMDGAPPLAAYITRSTVSSAFAAVPGGLQELDLSANPSPFQRRMVLTDVHKRLAEQLRAHTAGPVLLDFIDERLDVRMIGGSIITQSPELLRSMPPAPLELLIQSGSPAHRAAFRIGLQHLVSVVDPSRIVVNRVYWSEVDNRGERVVDGETAARNNALLDEFYGVAEECGIARFLSYGPDLLIADADHKWGRSPFHFVEELYASQLAQLGEEFP